MDFLIVGAHALAHHGVVRATGDLDIWIRCEPENAERTLEALVAFGATVAASGLSVADLTQPGNVYQLGLPPRRIDILTELTGLEFAECWERRSTVEVAGRDVPVLDRRSLLTNKRATGRPKDRADVDALEAEPGEG